MAYDIQPEHSKQSSNNHEYILVLSYSINIWLWTVYPYRISTAQLEVSVTSYFLYYLYQNSYRCNG